MPYVDPYLQPGPGALTSVQKTQIWLRRQRATGNSAADDANLLAITIDGISAAIILHTEREFFDPTGSDEDLARTFEYDGSGFLNLAPYDLRSITSVTLAGQTLTATTGAGDGDYVPMPRNKNRWGTYDYLTIRGYFKLGPSHFLSSPILKTRDVVITGKWGMTAVPADVELACLIAVDDHYRNPEQAEQRGSGEFQLVEAPRVPGSGGLPQGALDKLEPFRRVVF
jgi:hypothetical protein